jgi:hypothetical protein
MSEATSGTGGYAQPTDLSAVIARLDRAIQ